MVYLRQFILIIILCLILVSCNQAESDSKPIPTPIPTIDLPRFLFEPSHWELIDIKLGDQIINIEPIFPVYLSFQKTDDRPNALSIKFQSECYDNHESPRQDGFIMQFVSTNSFELISLSHTLNLCDEKRAPYSKILSRLRVFLTSYSIENNILYLSGMDGESGKEIIMSWQEL